MKLPYPQEHPYTSHIPHYNIFPNPKSHPPHLRTNPPVTLHSQPTQLTITSDSPENTTEYHQQRQVDQTDTVQPYKQPPSGDHQPCGRPHLYYVNHKAADFGMRVETRLPSSNTDPIAAMPEIEQVLWKQPKGFPHKVSINGMVGGEGCT